MLHNKLEDPDPNTEISSSTTKPLIFSSSSSSSASFSRQPIILQPLVIASPELTHQIEKNDVSIFLKLVAEGEQDSAEALLQKTPELALSSGEVTDLSDRTFKNITGFQYAVWALDWHMWTMIRKYLSNDDAREQLRGMKTNSWVEQHGPYVSLENFLDIPHAQKSREAFYAQYQGESDEFGNYPCGYLPDFNPHNLLAVRLQQYDALIAELTQERQQKFEARN